MQVFIQVLHPKMQKDEKKKKKAFKSGLVCVIVFIFCARIPGKHLATHQDMTPPYVCYIRNASTFSLCARLSEYPLSPGADGPPTPSGHPPAVGLS